MFTLDAALATVIAAKCAGALAGTIVALVFRTPRNRSEGLRRGIASFICGVIFSPYARSMLGLDPDFEGRLMGACVAAAVSWWILGFAYSAMRSRKNALRRSK